VVTVRTASTGKVKLPVTVRLSESVAVMENVTFPAPGGVPLRRPPDVKLSQPGNPVPDQP
jgi:hypothetical protein